MKDLPGGCKSEEELANYINDRVRVCMNDNNMSMEETVAHILVELEVVSESIHTFCDGLEHANPDFSRSYSETFGKKRKTRDHDAPNVTAPAQIKAEIKSEPQEDATSNASIPGGSKSVEEFEHYVKGRIFECMRDFRSKEEIVKDLLDQYRITLNTAWDDFQRANPDFFISYNFVSDAKRRIREHAAQNKRNEQESER